MEIDAYEQGTPSWVDLGTPDVPGAIAFYSGLFGWEIQEGPPEAGGYAMCMLRGRAVAGLGPQMNPGPPFWSSYVNVTDAEATAASVGENGGKVLMAPFDVMGFGRMGVFADPAGAAFSVWEPATLPGAGLQREPGALTWNELLTTDIEGALAFYPAVFGWEPETHGGAGPDGYTEWKVGGRPVAGMMLKPAMIADVPPHWLVYFAVADADASTARVAELGGSVMRPPFDVEPGRIAVVADPSGAVFSLLQPKDMAGA